MSPPSRAVIDAIVFQGAAPALNVTRPLVIAMGDIIDPWDGVALTDAEEVRSILSGLLV